MKSEFTLGGLTRKLARMIRSQGKDSRRQLLDQLPKGAVCAEIGVWKGDFSAEILDITMPQRLHLIDPWEFQEDFADRMYGGTVAKSQADMDEIFAGVASRFQNFPNVCLNRGKSEQILNDFPEGYFDWVYIDGNHNYPFVRQDLELSFRGVRPGGIIAGDDYLWGEQDGFPVKRAVKDFLASKGLQKRCQVIGTQFLIRR